MERSVQWSLAAAVWVLVLGLLALGWAALRRGAGREGAPPVPRLSDRPLCPVDRAEVTLAADTPRAVYQGREYYFCSRRDERGRDHKMLFLMDPEFYLRGVSSLSPPAETPTPAAGGAPVAP